jgi:hypothetical protein
MSKGFSNVELIIVGSIFGLLAMVAAPRYLANRASEEANELADQFRLYAAAFRNHLAASGEWPPDSIPGTVPAGMEGKLPKFGERIHSGGYWDWDPGKGEEAPKIKLVGCKSGHRVIEMTDQILDDGDLATGRLVWEEHRLALLLGE